MHAFLVSGATKEKRGEWVRKKLAEANVSPFDCVRLTRAAPSIGVTDVRGFTKQLALAPAYGKYLAGIIQDAHLLTTEAQNALLKTLEEPSPHSIIILETVNADLLLPTIVSRCQLMYLGATDQYTPDDLLQCINTLKQLRDARVGERAKMIDAIATDREAAKAWVERAIAGCRHELLQLIHTGCSIASPPKEIPQPTQMANLLRRLLTAQKQLAANVTPRLVLDSVFLPF